MNLVERLRELKALILANTHGQEPFVMWNDIKDDLSVEQRIQILTGWNRYLRTGSARELNEPLNQVIRQLE